MKNVLSSVFAMLCLIACSGSETQNTDSGKRIISLSPHITEILFELGEQENIIAVTDFCKYPEAALKIEKIGGLLNPDIEKIVTLNPTYIFGVPAHEKLNQELQKFNLKINMIPNENLSDVFNTIKIIGKTLHRSPQALALISSIKDSLTKLRCESPGLQAMLIIGREGGTLRNITVAGKNTFIDEIWHLVGGVNIFNDLPSRYGTVNLEAIIERNSDVIIEFDMQGDHAVIRQSISDEWDLLKNVAAIKNGHLFVIKGNHGLIPGPRVVLLAQDFKKIVHLVCN